MKAVLIALLLLASVFFNPTQARITKTEERLISRDPKNLGGHSIKCAGKKNQVLTSCKPPITLKPSPTADKPCVNFELKGVPRCNRPPTVHPKP